jgi:glycosyltransferase involved in cell wall biosynthesis
VTIVHIITGLGAGGAERMLTRIATFGFGPDAPRQVVVSLMDEGVHGEALRNAGVTVRCARMPRGAITPAALARLVRAVRAERPAVIMTWLYHADLLGTLVRPFVGGALVWNVRCSDMGMEHYPISSRLTLAALARLSRRPWAIATNSSAGRRVHERLGYAPRRWFYLPNGLDLDVFRGDPADRAAVRRELVVADHEVLIGLVARVDPMKDHATFMAAAERVASARPKAVFVLIGAGTERLALPPSLRARTRVLGERADVARLLRGLDVLVLSSLSEVFPNVVLEAMATEVPCVVTDAGDAASMVADTGVAVPVRNPAALAGGMATLIDAGAAGRQALGAAARARVADHWSLDRTAHRYLEVWRAAAAAHSTY